MKLAGIIAGVYICICTVVILFVVVNLYSQVGCGCVPSPKFTINQTENTTGSYFNITYVDPKGYHEVKNLKLTINEDDNLTTQYINRTLVQGTSYLFNTTAPNGTIVIVTVIADGIEFPAFVTEIGNVNVSQIS